MKNWLDKYNDGGPIQPNYNDASVSMSKDFVGDGYNTKGRNYSPAWGGQFQDGGTLKDNAERALALGSIATPFPLNYGLSLAGSAIDLYDAYNAKTPHDRNVQLTEAALGAIPYGRIVKGMKIGSDFYKGYKALKPIAAVNSVIDVKDTIDPNLKYAMGGSMPGTVGFTYARVAGSAPKKGPDAKDEIKTPASAQNGTWLDRGINKLYDAEDKLTKWLGNPMQRATNEAKSASYDYLGSNDDPIDSYRHSMAGNYTSKAIQDKLYNIPLVSQAAGFIGANVLGAGHEISTLIGHAPEFGGDDDRPWLDKIRESGEDAFNNMVGAGLGSIPFMSAKQKSKALLNMSLNNRLPDGHGQGNMYIKKKQNGGEMKYYQDGLDFKPKSISRDGSVIKDDMGQWNHPGEITEIGSNQITMKGVPYPVLGISDTGDTKMMYPNQDYEFIGDSVTEYPIMAQGGQLTKLDQLTNFTNYNTKQPGGWLSKYE